MKRYSPNDLKKLLKRANQGDKAAAIELDDYAKSNGYLSLALYCGNFWDSVKKLLPQFIDAYEPKNPTERAVFYMAMDDPVVDAMCGDRPIEEILAKLPAYAEALGRNRTKVAQTKPKKKTIDKHKRAWKIISRTRENFRESYQNCDTLNPTPTLRDYQVALGDKGIQFSTRTITTIIAEGKAGKLDTK